MFSKSVYQIGSAVTRKNKGAKAMRYQTSKSDLLEFAEIVGMKASKRDTSYILVQRLSLHLYKMKKRLDELEELVEGR